MQDRWVITGLKRAVNHNGGTAMAKRKWQTQSMVEQPEQEQDLQGLIAQKAYELYEQSGRVEGRDWDHWLEAERLVRGKEDFQG